MVPSSNSIPTVVVYNYLETFRDYLARGNDEVDIHSRWFNGDYGRFWIKPSKLILTTAPLQVHEYYHRLGYGDSQGLSPAHPSMNLSLDILAEPALTESLVCFAGTGRKLKMIPYATTTQFMRLAVELRAGCGLEILLPESPAQENLWLRDSIDTKIGFRDFANQWLEDPNWLPFAFICQDLDEASRAAAWFVGRGRSCVVKADTGGSGTGNVVLTPEGYDHLGGELSKPIRRALRANPYIQGDRLVVEELIPSSRRLSPSLEFFVPVLGQGQPGITYLSNQVFEPNGRFLGVMIQKELENAPWYPAFARAGLTMACNLQQMGYVGHFDLDGVVDDRERLFLLEVNARRTGGTFVHEFACQALGPDYTERAVLLSINALHCKPMACLDELLDRLQSYLYVPGSDCSGVVISTASRLPEGRFGAIFIAPSVNEIWDLARAVEKRLE